MNISDGLQKLIDAALQDGKLSAKEKEILINKAEKEGIDKDEFELYITSLVHEKKKRNDVGYSVNPYTGVKTEYSKKQTTKALIIVFGILILLGCFGTCMFNVASEAENNTTDKYISEFKFEEARKRASKEKCEVIKNTNLFGGEDKTECPRTLQLLKVYIAEAQFLIENKEYDKAISVIQEVSTLEYYPILLAKREIAKEADEYINETIVNAVLHILNNNQKVEKEKLLNYISKLSNEDKKAELTSRIQNSK